MRQFFWKLVLCFTPVALALWAIGWAWSNDRFKLGVDLSGGTILVYEIDARKQSAEQERTTTALERTNLLAEALKRRIDPNDLYNIMIRPAGSQDRVEIVIPTGGIERARKAQQIWDQLLEDLRSEYKGKNYSLKTLEVPRGRVHELAESIQQQIALETWEQELFSKSKPETLKQLVKTLTDLENGLKPLVTPMTEQAYRRLIEVVPLFNGAFSADPVLTYGILLDRPTRNLLSLPVVGGGALAANINDPYRLPTMLAPFKAKTLPGLITEVKERVDDYTKNKEIDSWFKLQAWDELQTRILKHWEKELLTPEKQEKLTKEEVQAERERREKLIRGVTRKEGWEKDLKIAANFPEKTVPDSVDELIGRVQFRGDVIGQAFYNTVAPLLGEDVLSGATTDDGKPAYLDRTEVANFITKLYGLPVDTIEKDIRKRYQTAGGGKDLTVEEVQRIKDLVARVGKLEFLILANSADDAPAIKDAQDFIKWLAENKSDKLDEFAVRGEPPPFPKTEGIQGKKKQYTLRLGRSKDVESVVTYRWVELGPQERQALNLNNGARHEPGRGRNWHVMKGVRNEQAKQLDAIYEGGEQKLLQGALFFSRDCKDRNLPEEERRDKQAEYFVLVREPEMDPDTGEPTPSIDGKYLVRVDSQLSEGRPSVSFQFSTEGGRLFGNLTRKNIPASGTSGEGGKRHLAIVLDGRVMSAPTINSEITTAGQITGSFTALEVNNLVNILRSGALPETLKPQPVSESTIGATLGEDTIRAGVTAIILAFLAVLAFMIVYYRFAGLVASVALLANLVLTIGFMVAVKATFTLPGLAGLVLMLGMAVDANILIYERLREERERGASLPLALRNGYERAFGTIIDTHLSSIFTAIVLYIVGNDALKGFGVTLTVGLIISLFTSLYMTRVLFDLWQSRGWLKKLTMLRLFARPDIDFMGIRYYWFTATIILTLLGVSLFLGRGTAGLNIDFVGGTAYAGELKKPIAINELRQLFDEDRQKELLQVEVKEGKDPKRDGYELSFPLIKDPMRRTRTVYLANLPEGDTPKEREANLKQRVSRLPEWSLEQIFLSGEQDPEAAAGDKSRYFNIRTLEKEPEIVQAVLDQLLQEKKGDSWEPLLKRVYMTYDLPSLQQGNFTRLRFYDSEGMSADKQPHDASPSFIKTLLMRELEREFGKPPSDWTFTLDLAGEGKGKDGRFAVMKLSFIPSGTSASKLEKAELDSVRKALDKAVAEFERRPQPMRLETFDSALAAETRLRAMAAILLSWGAILLYLWFRFGNWTFGLAAVLCLIHDLCFTLGVIAACHYIHTWWPGNPLGIEDFKIDLTAVAALLTLVGYSVNDTIVVFDRIREVRGKNPDLTPNMINDSVNQTLSRTVLASLTTWLVVVVLYIWGGPGVHLFAFVMVVGVIVGTYSSIYIASPLLLLFGEGSRAVARGRERAPTETPPDTRIQPAT